MQKNVNFSRHVGKVATFWSIKHVFQMTFKFQLTPLKHGSSAQDFSYETVTKSILKHKMCLQKHHWMNEINLTDLLHKCLTTKESPSADEMCH